MPRLKEVAARYQSKGLVVLGVSLDEDRAAFEQAVREHKIPWRQVRDGKVMEGELVRLFSIQGVPAHYLIDSQGRIAGKALLYQHHWAIDLVGEVEDQIVATLAKTTGEPRRQPARKPQP